MAKICQKTFHKHQRNLRAMMQDFEDMRVECCTTGQSGERDKLGMLMSHLHAAQSIGGGLCMKDENGEIVEPFGGGK